MGFPLDALAGHAGQALVQAENAEGKGAAHFPKKGLGFAQFGEGPGSVQRGVAFGDFEDDFLRGGQGMHVPGPGPHGGAETEVLPDLIGVQGEGDLETDMVAAFIEKAALETQGVAGGFFLRTAGAVFGVQDPAADEGGIGQAGAPMAEAGFDIPIIDVEVGIVRGGQDFVPHGFGGEGAAKDAVSAGLGVPEQIVHGEPEGGDNQKEEARAHQGKFKLCPMRRWVGLTLGLAASTALVLRPNRVATE